MKMNLKLSHKISLFSMAVTMLVVFASTGVDEYIQYFNSVEDAEEHIQMLADVTAFSIAAPAMFGDAAAATKVLEALRVNPAVVSAQLTTSEEKPLAQYQRVLGVGTVEMKHFTIPVRWQGQKLGELLIDMDVSELNDDLFRQIWISLLLTLMSVLAAGLGVYFMVHRVTNPFRDLSDVAEKIVNDSDYSLRAVDITTGDEVGSLTGAFNAMLDHIEIQNLSLQESQIILRSKEQRLVLATSAARLGVWEYDVRGNRILWDKRMSDIYGVEHNPEGQKPNVWIDRIHPDDRDQVTSSYYKVLDDGGDLFSAFRLIFPHGPIKYVTANAKVLRDTDGVVVRMIGICLDDTKRELAQVALKNAESLSQESLTQANLANTELSFQKYALDEHAIVSIANVRGEILYANNRFCDISGYSREELIGKNTRLVVSDAYPLEYLQEIRLAIAEGRTWSGDMENVKKSGDVYWVSATVVPSVNDGGEILSYIVIATDITAVKTAEAMLRRSQKMESVGELAGGLAHDFNNLLGIIIGNLDLMSAHGHLNEVLRKQLDIAQTAALRGSILTRSLLDFSSRSEGNYSPVDVGKVISGFEELIRKSITASISLETYLPHGLFSVELNPDDLEDALINLSLNARDAMPNGGSLIIRLQDTIIESAGDNSEVEIEPGEYLEMSISDTGGGISSEVCERIFDPFFTTKGKAEGTGLGLAMVYGFVKRTKGYIFVFSKIGLGTTFTMYFPRSKFTVKQPEAPARIASMMPSGIETILVVDDEVELAVIAKSVLEDLGYTVVCSDNGPAALQVLEENTTIDLVFSDVVMPGGMSGLDLGAIITNKYPHVKLLLTTGFAVEADSPMSVTESKYEVLRKPYRGMELAKRVRKILDEVI
ncbi:MAG: PAS domain-containing protein [Halioglobus sp.]|nr:PAS domain-containing protein [Halioglobus sp.]